MPIQPLQQADLPQVAQLHVQSLPGDFLPSLGARFLEVLYTGMLELDLAWGFVARDDGQLHGFVIGTADNQRLFGRLIRARTLGLTAQVMQALLRKPRLIMPTLETFLYPSKEGGSEVAAELLVLAVVGERRGMRIGEQLLRELEQSFVKRGQSAYKLTVLERNTRAQRFYERCGLLRSGSFSLYRKDWVLYCKSLNALATEQPEKSTHRA